MSAFLKIELIRAGKERGVVENVRGVGTFIGFDTPSHLTDNL